MSKKKTHRIYARDGNVMLDGLKTSKGKVDFGTNTAVYVDEATAKEVDERYGGKDGNVIVAKDEQYERALDGEGWQIKYDSKRGDWVKTVHKWKFQGVDTSHFKVWVYKRGKLARITKAEALRKGYRIVSTSKQKPTETLQTAQGAEVTNDDSG